MRIQIITKRTLANGADLRDLLNRISAEFLMSDGTGAYALPADVKFGLTPENIRVNKFSTDADTTVIWESPEYQS